MSSWLGSLKPSTVKAYASDLRSFTAWLDVEASDEAIKLLITDDNGAANRLTHDYKTAMVDQNLAAATINRRLSTLRAVITHCRTIGLIDWTLDCRSVKAKKSRDTKGPGIGVVRELIEHLNDQETAKAARDKAILRLMFDRGLRRGEVFSLDYGDIDAENCAVWLASKGHTDKESVTIGPIACEAINEWLEHRGHNEGPLFVNLSRNPQQTGTRLTGRSVARSLDTLAQTIGTTKAVRPHGICHTAITTALDKTGGDYRQVQAFSRHAKIETVTIYDDNRTDQGGTIANLIADIVR